MTRMSSHLAVALLIALLATGCATSPLGPAGCDKSDRTRGGVQWSVHWDKARALGVTETDIYRAIDRFLREHRGHMVRNDWIERLEIVTQTGKVARFSEIAEIEYFPDESAKHEYMFID